MESLSRQIQPAVIAGCLLLAVSLGHAPVRVAADASEIEPNNTCAAANHFAVAALPFSIRGSLDTPPDAPDVDYFRLAGTPGAQWQVDLEGAGTGLGTLPDPALAAFDSGCNSLFNSYGAYAPYGELTVPADGVVVLAASSGDDSAFTGSTGGAGSYMVTVKTLVEAVSIRGRLIDGKTGAPVSGGDPTQARTILYRCGATEESWCAEWWGDETPNGGGEFAYTSGPHGPDSSLKAGRYQVSAWASGYGTSRSAIFTLAAGEAKVLPDLSLYKARGTLEPTAVTNMPNVDGDLAEWNAFPLDALDRDTASTTWGAAPERADLMGVMKWAWRTEGIYVALHVRDDALVHDSTDLTKDDVFELAIDGDDDGTLTGPSDHLYRVAEDGRQSDRGAASDALTVARRTVPTGWDLELFLPASHLNLGTLVAGRPLRFNWALGDDDNGGGSDNRLIAFGSRLDPPEATWPVVPLGNYPRSFAFTAETGRWEWTGGGAFNDIFFLDAAHGWAAGPGVWRTDDGGATWTRLPALAMANPQKIVFADRYRGWAQSADSRVFRTEDGGETWEFATRTQTHYLSEEPDLSYLGPPVLETAGTDDVWAAGTWDACGPDGCEGGGSVYHSGDGGITWGGPAGLFYEGDVIDLDFINRTEGWALGSSQAYGGACPLAIAATSDGGWSCRTSCLSSNPKISPGRIAFTSPTNGWVVATDTSSGRAMSGVFATTDGAASWQKQAEWEGSANWIQAQDTERVWAGIGLATYRTTDGGATWLPLSGEAPTRATFKSSTAGWGIRGNEIVKTANDAASWGTMLTLPIGEAPWWLDHLIGWRVLGSDIERTTDGGGTWETESTGLAAIDGFQFVDARNGWAWHNGTGVLVHSTDSGVTWDPQLAGATLDGLQFVDGLTGWRLDDQRNLLRSTDGGTSWHEVAPSDAIGQGVQFVNREHGSTYGVTSQGDDLGYWSSWSWHARTTDGGVTWSHVPGGGPSVAVKYLDANYGWGLGYWEDGDRFGVCWWSYSLDRTTDGEHWDSLWSTGHDDGRCAPRPYWTPWQVTAIYALDPERVWTLGINPIAGGPIAASTDGGKSWVAERVDGANPADVRFDRTGSAYAHDNGTLRYRNTEIAAYRAPGPLQIDGDLAEWQGVPAYGIKGGDAIRVDGASPVPLDGSALLQAAWDTDNLYFAVRVYDDTTVVDSGTQPWLDDSIELGLDANHDHIRNWDKGYDRQFTVNAEGPQFESGVPTGLLSVARRTLADAYVLEIALPRSALGDLDLASQTVLGFNWLLSDDDDGGNYDSRLLWLGQGTYQADAGWGRLRLSEIAAPASTDEPTPSLTPTATETPTATPDATRALRIFLPLIMR